MTFEAIERIKTILLHISAVNPQCEHCTSNEVSKNLSKSSLARHYEDLASKALQEFNKGKLK